MLTVGDVVGIKFAARQKVCFVFLKTEEEEEAAPITAQQRQLAALTLARGKSQ